MLERGPFCREFALAGMPLLVPRTFSLVAVRERLLGSGEVIESLIGEYKRLRRSHSERGMTGIPRSSGAIVANTIRRELDSIKTRDVDDRFESTSGATMQAQREPAFEGTKPAHGTGRYSGLVRARLAERRLPTILRLTDDPRRSVALVVRSPNRDSSRSIAHVVANAARTRPTSRLSRSPEPCSRKRLAAK